MKTCGFCSTFCKNEHCVVYEENMSLVKVTPGKYRCPGSSCYFVVLKVRYNSEKYVVVKAQFETIGGTVVERKNYRLDYDRIQHWEKISGISTI